MPRGPIEIEAAVRGRLQPAFFRVIVSAIWILTALLNTTPLDAATSAELSRETRFLNALSEIDQGQYSSAIKSLRSVLAEDPSLVRVRLELARVYYLAEEWSLARQEFFFALSGDLPREVRAKVLAYIASIDSRRGFDWDLSVSIVSAGDTRRYDSDVIPLNFGGSVLSFKMDREPLSSPGLRLEGRLTLREEILKLSKNRSVLAYISADFGILKTRYEALDNFVVELRPGVRLTFPRSTVDLSLAANRRWQSGHLLEDGREAKLAFESRRTSGYSFFGWVTGYRYRGIAGVNQNRRGTEASLGFRRSFAGTGECGMRLEGGRLNFDRSFDSYYQGGLSLFCSLDAGSGFQVSPTLRFLRRQYNNVNPLFLSSPNETISELVVRVRKTDRIIGDGFVPYVEVSGIRSKSGIEALSYRNYRFSFGLSRNF